MTLTGGVILLMFWAFHQLLIDPPGGRQRLRALAVGVMLVAAGWAQLEW